MCALANLSVQLSRRAHVPCFPIPIAWSSQSFVNCVTNDLFGAYYWSKVIICISFYTNDRIVICQSWIDNFYYGESAECFEAPHQRQLYWALRMKINGRLSQTMSKSSSHDFSIAHKNLNNISVAVRVPAGRQSSICTRNLWMKNDSHFSFFPFVRVCRPDFMLWKIDKEILIFIVSYTCYNEIHNMHFRDIRNYVVYKCIGAQIEIETLSKPIFYHIKE